MKKVMILALAALVVGLMASAALAQTDLIMDGRDTAQDVGDVTVSYSADGTTATINISVDGWCLKDAHVTYADEAENLPATGGGNPKLKDFTAKEEFEYEAVDPYDKDTAPPCTSGWTVDLNNLTPGETYVVAVHVGLVNSAFNEDSGVWEYTFESAWAQGEDWPDAKNWAMYFEITPTAAE